MNKNLLTHCYILLFIILIVLGSCKKFVSVPPPDTEVEQHLIFQNDQSAISATVGLYSQMMQSSRILINGAATIYPALSADEIRNTTVNADYDAFRSVQLNELTTGLPRLWTHGYKHIYHANAVIEGLQRSNYLTDDNKKQLLGEMKLARAYCYLLLVNLFGDVPLVLESGFLKSGSLPRSSVDEIYNQIINDLQEARSLLSENYPATGKTRPNKWTAAALLSRTHLLMKNWSAAEHEATQVINAGVYTLESNLNNVFLSNSKEAIWQLSPVSETLNTAEGNLFIPATSTGRPAFSATTSLLDAFEPGDQRRIQWLKNVTVSGIQYAYPFKYKVRLGAPPYQEHLVCIRLAELYLIRSEARAHLNQLETSLEDLNIIRARAGLLPFAGNDLLQQILKERQIELMFEWGHRWIDLKRNNLAQQVLEPIKSPNWQNSDQLYPIPFYELETNPFLIQNPGY